MDYNVLSSSEDEEAWLAARREGVTATDAARLATGGAAEWVKLKAEKAGGEQAASNAFLQWGHDREPVIADQVKHLGEHNTHLLQHKDDPRWLATPDLIDVEAGMVGDIKTAVWRGRAWDAPPDRYFSQLQWQMFVTGATASVLVVEFHEDFRVKFLDPHVLFVPRDQEHVDHLIVLAERFLDMGEPTEDDVLLARAVEAKQKIKTAQAEWSELEEEILERIGDREKFTHVHPELGSLSFTKPQPRNQFMAEKFKENHPDLYDDFTVEGRVPKPSVRITPVKEKK